MLKVVETFSGIGSQAKALNNIDIEHEIIRTVEWDVNAMIAYDLIHNGKQNLKPYNNMTKDELYSRLIQYTLSMDGKKPATQKNMKDMSEELMKRILCAIDRCHNLVSITDVSAYDIPSDTDLLTYSFPCQDLSVAGNWHGNNSGIDRNAHNRSGMLWEIERILKEKVNKNMVLPKFLLMENVSNILSNKHIANFTSWTDYLMEIGYVNKVYTLDASKFGIPQKRVRTYMISVFVGDDEEKKNIVENYFETHDLSDTGYIESLKIKSKELKKILKLDYTKKKYRIEADLCQPNDTPSRRDIYEDNVKIFVNNCIATEVVPTVTTKQDRHPNSGVIDYFNGKDGKSLFRYLTPRECFLLMGFDERDYENIVNNNFKNRSRAFFNIEKLNRMAGNSIVVNVLEEIFRQVDYLNEKINIQTEECVEKVITIEDINSKLKRMLEKQNSEYKVIKQRM